MANLALNAKRADYFLIRPNDPNVEVYIELNPNSPRFDKRGLRTVDPTTVDSLAKFGQIQPAEGEKVETTSEGKQRVCLTAGRGRWKAINVLWERERAAGLKDAEMTPFKLIIRRNMNDAERMARAIVENEHREADSPIDRATKAALLYNKCLDKEFVRVTFKLPTVKAVDDLLALLDTDASVQSAVADGSIAPGAARALAQLPTEEQQKLVAEIKASGAAPARHDKRVVGTRAKKGEGAGAKKPKAGSVRSVAAAVRKAQGKEALAKVRRASEIKARLEEEEKELADAATPGGKLCHKRVIETLKWCLGEED